MVDEGMWDWDFVHAMERLERRMAERQQMHEAVARDAHRRGEFMVVMLPGPVRKDEAWTMAMYIPG